MTPREFLDATPNDEVKEVAKEAGTTFENFKQIAYGGHVSGKLALRISLASKGAMTLEEIISSRADVA